MIPLTQSLPFKGFKKDYDIMMTNANKNNYIIYFHLPSGWSGSHLINWMFLQFVMHVVYILESKIFEFEHFGNRFSLV